MSQVSTTALAKIYNIPPKEFFSQPIELGYIKLINQMLVWYAALVLLKVHIVKMIFNNYILY